MDYSSAVDQPVARSFDNFIEGDAKGTFMLDNSAKCFNHCVLKVTEAALNENEISCLKDCYVKSFYSSSLGNNLSLN